jgi:hypothetical protein
VEIACFTFGKLGSEDDRFAVDDVDGMAQRAASQVVVDEGRDYSGFGQAEPNGHVFRPIIQQKGHRVTRLEAAIDENVGHFVAQLVNL